MPFLNSFPRTAQTHSALQRLGRSANHPAKLWCKTTKQANRGRHRSLSTGCCPQKEYIERPSIGAHGHILANSLILPTTSRGPKTHFGLIRNLVLGMHPGCSCYAVTLSAHLCAYFSSAPWPPFAGTALPTSYRIYSEKHILQVLTRPSIRKSQQCRGFVGLETASYENVPPLQGCSAGSPSLSHRHISGSHEWHLQNSLSSSYPDIISESLEPSSTFIATTTMPDSWC